MLETESATKAQCNASICAECFEDIVHRLQHRTLSSDERRTLQLLTQNLLEWEKQQVFEAKAAIEVQLEAEHQAHEKQLDSVHNSALNALRDKIVAACYYASEQRKAAEQAQAAATTAGADESNMDNPRIDPITDSRLRQLRPKLDLSSPRRLPTTRQRSPVPIAHVPDTVVATYEVDESDDEAQLAIVLNLSLQTATAEDQLRQALALSEQHLVTADADDANLAILLSMLSEAEAEDHIHVLSYSAALA